MQSQKDRQTVKWAGRQTDKRAGRQLKRRATDRQLSGQAGRQ